MRLIDADNIFPYGVVLVNPTDGMETYRNIMDAIENAPTLTQPNELGNPCDLCVYTPSSSFDGKPCTYCPAAGRPREGEGTVQE